MLVIKIDAKNKTGIGWATCKVFAYLTTINSKNKNSPQTVKSKINASHSWQYPDFNFFRHLRAVKWPTLFYYIQQGSSKNTRNTNLSIQIHLVMVTFILDIIWSIWKYIYQWNNNWIMLVRKEWIYEFLLSIRTLSSIRFVV